MCTCVSTEPKFGICPECEGCSDQLPKDCESLEEFVCPEKLYECVCDPVCDLAACLICAVFLGVLACPYAITRHLCCIGCINTYKCCENTFCVVKQPIITLQPLAQQPPEQSPEQPTEQLTKQLTAKLTEQPQ